MITAEYNRLMAISPYPGRTNISIQLLTQLLPHFFLVVYLYRVTQKTGTFEKPNKNLRNTKKKLLTEIEPLQLAF